MKRVFFAMLLLLAFATLVIRYWPRNYGYLLVLKGYTVSAMATDSRENLRRAWGVACNESPGPACGQAYQADAVLLPLVDNYYLDHGEQLYVITDTMRLAAADLRLGGRIELSQVTGDQVTLFGEGSLEARLFLLADGVEEWTIAVTAIHDAPPPVNLQLWIDDDKFGTLAFDKGDQSWETLSVSGNISPHFHRLTLWFVNDYVDVAAGLDRNAYIEQITIIRSRFRP